MLLGFVRNLNFFVILSTDSILNNPLFVIFTMFCYYTMNAENKPPIKIKQKQKTKNKTQN